MDELIPIQRSILTSARDDGMIPFPQGPAQVVETIFKVMEDMASRGYLEYVRKTWYRAYWLTKKGWSWAQNFKSNLDLSRSGVDRLHRLNRQPRARH